MRIGTRAAPCIALLALIGSACAGVHAQVLPSGPPLDVPQPPAHVVVPVEAEPAAAIDPPATEATSVSQPTRRVTRPTPPKPDKTDKAEKIEKVEPPVAAPSLQTTANVVELEQKIRGVLARAARDLARVDQKSLNTDRKQQYDAATRFTQQAEEALKVKNLVFAEQLADKAATMAALLAGR